MTATPTYRKKLIEVALPLEAINKASAREKSIRHGHPSTLHLWWARRPLAACRAVLFASIVDDPSSLPELFPDEERQEAERQRLFRIIEDLVLWENSTNEIVLHAARTEIARSVARDHSVELPAHLSAARVREALAQYAPPVLDPFAGGGSIPLEAQRLGLEAHGSDLNPVAVLITKALIEIPPLFAGQPPVSAGRAKARQQGLSALTGPDWPGASGLAADVRHYGQWMRDEAFTRIGHLYPTVQLPKEHGGGEATVIAWLWARTVTCPNPACGAQMPLVRSFELSRKKGKQAWVEPIVDRAAKTVRFEVKTGSGVPRDGTVNRQGAKCLICDAAVPFTHIRAEGKAHRMSSRMMAIVAEGRGGRIYLSAGSMHEDIAEDATGGWFPDATISHWPGRTNVVEYGLTTFGSLFTPRQLVALTTFSDLVGEARERVEQDALAAGLPSDPMPLSEGGRGARAYSDAVATYLAFAVDKVAEGNTNLCTWSALPSKLHVVSTFGRQALPMVWDYAEANPFADSAGNMLRMSMLVSEVVNRQGATSALEGVAIQHDARSTWHANGYLICTDPPYYDNIGYADLSDFFYVWLRKSVGYIWNRLFPTLLTPKTAELIASPYRFDGDAEAASHFFEEGLRSAFDRIHENASRELPISIFYAFKQTESVETGGNGLTSISSTGWETMLEGLIQAGIAVNGTWPVRTERSGGFRNKNQNALASSIVLVCRPRPDDAPVTTRQGFIRELRRELPEALRMLQHGNIAPVDLAQASIGPGMAVFSRYSRVLEPSGDPMPVRTALQLINQTLDEVLTEQEGEFDSDTRWALAWYEQFGMDEGPYGTAEVLSSAKNTAVSGLAESGIVLSRSGKVRLLRRDELSADWNPQHDRRLPVWEVTQRLILALEQDGEQGAAAIAKQVGGLGEVARDLSYRLYVTSERKGWAAEALPYNSLVVAWPAIAELAAQGGTLEQATLV